MLRVGMRHDCGSGWCVCVTDDPYGRDDLVSIRVQWDDATDEFPPLTMQHTIGIDPRDVHYYEHAVRTFTGCANSPDHGRHLVHREQERIARLARSQQQSESLWRYRQKQADEQRKRDGESARSLYAAALKEGNATKAEWIRKNWNEPGFASALQTGEWMQG